MNERHLCTSSVKSWLRSSAVLARLNISIHEGFQQIVISDLAIASLSCTAPASRFSALQSLHFPVAEFEKMNRCMLLHQSPWQSWDWKQLKGRPTLKASVAIRIRRNAAQEC